MSVLGGFRSGRLVSQLQTLDELESPQAQNVIDRLRKLGGAAIKSILEELQLTRKDDSRFLVRILSRLVLVTLTV